MVFKRQIHEPNSGGCKRCPGGLRHGWIENGDLPIKSSDFSIVMLRLFTRMYIICGYITLYNPKDRDHVLEFWKRHSEATKADASHLWRLPETN